MGLGVTDDAGSFAEEVDGPHDTARRTIAVASRAAIADEPIRCSDVRGAHPPIERSTRSLIRIVCGSSILSRGGVQPIQRRAANTSLRSVNDITCPFATTISRSRTAETGA